MFREGSCGRVTDHPVNNFNQSWRRSWEITSSDQAKLSKTKISILDDSYPNLPKECVAVLGRISWEDRLRTYAKIREDLLQSRKNLVRSPQTIKE